MSSHKSTNLNLHLWEPEDDFLRQEFVENFTTLDREVARKVNEAVYSSRINSIEDTITAIRNTVAGKCQIIIGSYVGNGLTTRTFGLGFRPKAILLERSDGVRGQYETCSGLALDGYPLNSRALTITSSGFSLYFDNSDFTINSNGTTYLYLIFR